jgi:hypothetical protein
MKEVFQTTAVIVLERKIKQNQVLSSGDTYQTYQGAIRQNQAASRESRATRESAMRNPDCLALYFSELLELVYCVLRHAD